MRFARLFGLAGGICFVLTMVGSAVLRSACEGDLEDCGTAGETAWSVTIVSAALALVFLALAGLALLSRVVRRAR